ncbi:MAG TPA: T9SS type A sorting domain-containing protein, partial [Ignavibacteriaceae bacterium]
PFNSSTIIKYQIPKEVRARISLYNILGEKILTLFEGEQKAGEHEIKLTSNDLPSGNYFYGIETDLYQEVKKLTILK